MVTSLTPAALDTRSPQFEDRLASLLRSLWGEPVEVANLHRFPRGFSWITLGFTAHVGTAGDTPRAHRLILRLGDPAGLLAPYRAGPEFRALSALAGTAGLPIPQVYAFSDDPAPFGAPFILSQWVAGDVPRPFEGAGNRRDDSMVRSLSEDFVDALCALHRFDWSRSPLAADTVARAEAATRETHAWARHARVSQGDTPPQMRYAMHWLLANAPVADRITVVHGDYRVGNFLQQDGRITAILDWEFVHLGDPHEDLAWAGLRAYAAGTARVGGLLEREAFYARYQAGTGFEVRPDLIRYYEVLGQFKLTSMFVGAVQRVEAGTARDARMAAVGLQLTPMLLELNRLIEVAQ